MTHPFRSACALVAAFGAAAIMACSGDIPNGPDGHGPQAFTSIPAPAGGVAQFSVLPVAIAPGLTLTALGSLNPPGHVLPTDHVYWYDWDLSKGSSAASDVRDVFAPATGAVIWIGDPAATETDNKIIFRSTDHFYYYIDHVVLSPMPTVGQIIQAGTKLGVTLPGFTLDLGAFDDTVTHAGFVNTARYPVQTLGYVSPWKYFTPDLQAQIAPHMYRAPSAPQLDGQIDFGVAGKLVGDWFVPSMPADSSWEPYGWTRTTSFAYDYYDPSQVRISIGGTVGPAGVWAIDSTVPRPETVTAASGLVRYLLYSPFDKGFPPYGEMLVQMTDSATIKVELFVGSTSQTQFDGSAFIFVR